MSGMQSDVLSALSVLVFLSALGWVAADRRRLRRRLDDADGTNARLESDLDSARATIAELTAFLRATPSPQRGDNPTTMTSATPPG